MPKSNRGAGRSGVATIHDVAARAGVSIKTVSRVVNREPNVRDETTRVVQKAIAELNYRPNFSARNLAGRKAYLIALVYDNPSDSYLIGIQKGALNACRQLGYSLLLQPCQFDSPYLLEEMLTLLRERRPAGLMLTPPVCDVKALLDALDEQQVDYVGIGALPDRHEMPIVRTDDRLGAYDMTSYLINLGHRQIAFIKGHPAHASAQVRLDGYLQAHADAAISVDETLIMQGMFTFESGLECARVLLARRQRPTAIFAANDDMAAGVLHAAHAAGIAVPDQLSVAGFDDIPSSRSVWPSLTTIRQPIRAMAERSVHVLLDYIANRAGANVPPTEVMRDELIIRDSTAPPRASTSGK